MNHTFKMTANDIRQQALERLGSLCNNTVLNKIWAGAGYGARAYIYNADMELSTPQSLLLGLLYSLVTEEITSCSILSDACHRVEQLRSDHLRVWLAGDFVFPRHDIEKAVALLARLLDTGILKLPSHVTRVMTSLATKYGINNDQLSTFVLMEPTVLVRVRPEDKEIVKDILKPVESDYEEITGLPVKLYLDEENELPKESEGGVVLISLDYTVSLDNTLASRLEHTSFHLLPEINQMLYGDEIPAKDKQGIKLYPSYLPSVEVVRHRIEKAEKKIKQGDINIDKTSIGNMSLDENLSYSRGQSEDEYFSIGSLFSFEESKKE